MTSDGRPARRADPAERPRRRSRTATRDATQPPARSAPLALAVVDLDGVVADVRHRLPYLERRPKDWAGFFRAAPDDPPLQTGVDAVRKLAEVYEVVYLSGRPEWCRADTVDWFERHDLPDGDLYLRPPGDYRPARVMKVERLRQLHRRAPVAVLVDDDEDVLSAARAAGFDVLPATWMGDAPALHEAQEQDGRT